MKTIELTADELFMIERMIMNENNYQTERKYKLKGIGADFMVESIESELELNDKLFQKINQMRMNQITKDLDKGEK